MPLTIDQKHLCQCLENLVAIDHELDEIRSQEDRLNLRRRNLAQSRIDVENTLRAAYAAAGYPAISIVMNSRMVLFDSRVGILSLRAITPTCFALLASPTPEIEPCEPELLVAHPLGIASTLPEFNEEES